LKRVIKLTIFFAVLSLLASCVSWGGNDNDTEPQTIKVLYWDKQSFFERYGNFLSLEFPNIEFDVVPLKQAYVGDVPPEEALNKLIETEQPDLLHINYYDYLKLANSNTLQSLETIKGLSDAISFKPVLDKLKATQNNELYGIAPSFNSNAVYVNLDLFEQNGVSVPQSKLSWDEFINLVQRFNVKPGLSFENSDPFDFAVSLGFLQGLRISDSNRKLLINSDSWKEIFEEIKTLVSGGFVTLRSQSTGDLFSNTFMQGNSAMTIDTDNFNNLLLQQKEEKKVGFDWATIALPYNTQNPSGISAIILEDIFSINKESENKEAASKILEYLLSDEMSKITFNSARSLPSNASEKFITDNNLAAFYAEGEPANDINLEFGKYSDSFLQEFNERGKEMTRKILDNETSVEDALMMLQKELSVTSD